MDKKAFGLKSLLFAGVCLFIVMVFSPYIDRILHVKVMGGALPAIPLFLIVLLSFVWNKLAGRFAGRLALSGGELAVIFGLMLVISWVPAVQQSMVRQLILPRYEEMTTNASWGEAGVTARMPERLFPREATGEMIGEKTHFGMIQGGVPVNEVPLRAWAGPLLAWSPLLIMLSLCFLAMTFLVHRQWTRHEQLQYPLAAVANLLIKQTPGNKGGSIFINRLFWCGFTFVFSLYFIRYMHTWFPTYVPNVDMSYSLNWSKLFPSITPSNSGIFSLSWISISFAIIGIAYFVPSDVSLTIGLTAPIGTILGIQYYIISGNPVSSNDLDIFRAGGFIAFGIILAYTGRTYYLPIMLKACGYSMRGRQTDPGGVWAARVFLAAYASLIVIFMSLGVDLMMSFIIVTFVLLIFLVVTRLVCETGVPTMTAGWSLSGILTGLLGSSAMGAGPIMFISFLSQTLVDTSSTELAMPYMATGLKIVEDNQVDKRRFAVASKIFIIAALIVGFAAVIIFSYTKGQGNLERAERMRWNVNVQQVLAMMDFGQYEASEAAQGLSKAALIKPSGRTVGLMLTGLIAVIACYFMRFRFVKWPLHPLFFVVIGSSVAAGFWMCFLLGWAIKTVLIKVGGGRIYLGAKPLFVGFVAGEFLFRAMVYIVGYIYFLSTGRTGPELWRLL